LLTFKVSAPPLL